MSRHWSESGWRRGWPPNYHAVRGDDSLATLVGCALRSGKGPRRGQRPPEVSAKSARLWGGRALPGGPRRAGRMFGAPKFSCERKAGVLKFSEILEKTEPQHAKLLAVASAPLLDGAGRAP